MNIGWIILVIYGNENTFVLIFSVEKINANDFNDRTANWIRNTFDHAESCSVENHLKIFHMFTNSICYN